MPTKNVDRTVRTKRRVFSQKRFLGRAAAAEGYKKTGVIVSLLFSEKSGSFVFSP
jgi:hypothetical protein